MNNLAGTIRQQEDTMDAQTKATPGPWKIYNHQFDGLRVEAEDDSFVAQIGVDTVNRRANAKLIKEAPAMLEVLRDIAKYDADDGMRALELLTSYQEEARAILDRIS